MSIALPARRRRRRGDPGAFGHRVAGYPCIERHCRLYDRLEDQVREVVRARPGAVLVYPPVGPAYG